MTKLIKFELSHKKWLRHYQQIGFVWAIFIVSALPFFLMLSATRPELQNQGNQLLSKLPLIGSPYAAITKWYTDNVSPVEELRILVTFPDKWEGRWFDIDKNYARFEKYFADHIGFRDLMIRSKNELDYRLFRTSTRVYFGKESEIYGRPLIDIELPRSEAILDSPEKILVIHREILNYTKKLKAQGVTTLFITPMQKEYFMPGLLPFFAPRLPEATHFMTFYGQLKSDPALNFVDVFGIIKSIQGIYPIYYHQDFHWTNMAALAVAKTTTNLIASLENSETRWQHPTEIQYLPFTGSDARFSARLFASDKMPEPELIKTWKDVHTLSPLDIKKTGLEYETDTVESPNLLPPTCMYGNSFSDGLRHAGLLDYFQKFTKIDRQLSLSKVPDVIKGRCKYLIVQVLDIQAGHWLSLSQ